MMIFPSGCRMRVRTCCEKVTTASTGAGIESRVKAAVRVESRHIVAGEKLRVTRKVRKRATSEDASVGLKRENVQASVKVDDRECIIPAAIRVEPRDPCAGRSARHSSEDFPIWLNSDYVADDIRGCNEAWVERAVWVEPHEAGSVDRPIKREGAADNDLAVGLKRYPPRA